MYLKLAAVLAFVATCSARYYGAENYYVDVGSNSIRVSNGYGQQATFVVDQFYGYAGPQAVTVLFQGQDVVPRTVQFVDQQSAVEGRFQSDILYQLFTDYTGPLDEIEYQKLLNLVSTYVQNGQINPAVLYALQALFGQYEALNYFDQVQGLQTSGLGFLFGQRYNSLYGGLSSYSKVGQYGLGSWYPRVGSYYTNSLYGGLSPYSKVGQYGLGSWYPRVGSFYMNRDVSNNLPSVFKSYYAPYSSGLYQSRFWYPQRYYGGYYGPYSNYAYQYGTYGAYPQQYFGGYYGPYASNSLFNLFRGYGSNLRYQWPLYNF